MNDLKLSVDESRKQIPDMKTELAEKDKLKSKLEQFQAECNEMHEIVYRNS